MNLGVSRVIPAIPKTHDGVLTDKQLVDYNNRFGCILQPNFHPSIYIIVIYNVRQKIMPGIDKQAYLAVFRETKNPAILADQTFTIQDVNDACLERTGYAHEELTGQTPAMLINDSDTFTEIIDTLSDDVPWEGTFEIRTKHNHIIYGHGTATPIIQDGEPIAYAGFWVDLTNQRRYEYSLQILNRVLRHDLRNDANVILGYIDTVREQVADPQLAAYLDKVSDKMQTVVAQAETARDLETLLTDKAKTANVPMRIDTVLEQVVAKFKAEYPDSEISFDHEEGRAVYASADEAIEKVFEAVVENAIEHNDKETPVVELWVEEDDKTLTVFVGDNGPGIPESQHEQVFGRKEENQVQHGQGLSLFFVDQMTEKYHGSNWIEDNNSEGAVFVIELIRSEDEPV